ncbi:hypothetical protein, partial [Cronobacter sakazakii]|uniref:hypothetical protein n=1 Tax=Cronobacter sakazakii TaxID=28141 RepID=UPI001F42E9F9
KPGTAWRPYDDTPHFSEGVEVERLIALPGTDCLIAFAKYSGYYIMVKKRPEPDPLIEYHIPGKGWRSCTSRAQHGGLTMTLPILAKAWKWNV